MKKEFAINLIFLLALNAIIKPFYLFGIDRNMQLQLGTEAYGLYYNLFSFTLILQVVNDFGLQNYTSKYASQNRGDIKTAFKDFAGLKIILSIGYLILTLLLAFLYNYEKNVIPIVFHLAINQILISLVFFFRSNLIGIGFYRLDSVLSVLDRLLLIFLGLIILYVPFWKSQLNISLFVWIQTISLLITALLALYFCIKKGFAFVPSFARIHELKKIGRATFPFFLIGLFNLLLIKQDSLILKKLLNSADFEIGIYASSMRLYDAATLVSLTFGGLLLAMFSNQYTQKVKLSQLFEFSNQLLLFLTMIIVACILPHVAEINSILYYTKDAYWNQILFWCFLGFIPGSINYIFGAYLQAIHFESTLWKIYAAGFILNGLLNVLLIPYWKAEACAISFCITQLFLFAVQLFFIYRSKTILWSWPKFLRLCIFAMLSVSTGWMISKNLQLNILVEWISSGLIILVLAFLLDVVNFSSLRNLLNQKMNRT